MAWIELFIAGIFEVVWSTCMKYSNGFTNLKFTILTFAGMAVSCNMAAIEAGADTIDLAMSPLSGGTCEADILVMYQRLRGTEYTIDIDPENIF